MNAEAGGEPRPAAPVAPVTPGELLRTEREHRALTVQQAAEELHLDAWIIEALETNRFLALGAPVYARGHLRKYALLLGLSPTSILERYETLSDTPVVPTPIPTSVAVPTQIERRSMKVPLWIGVALLVGALAWGAFELWKGISGPRSPDRTSVEAQPPAAAAVENEAVVADEAPAVTTAPPSAPAAAPLAAAASAEQRELSVGASRDEPVADATERPGEASPGADVVRLRLEFSDASWTEIYDAAGKRLMFDLGAPGRVRSVSGVAPLRVTLGFAGAVSLRINDRPQAIPRRPGRDAAKFTVATDGSVQP